MGWVVEVKLSQLRKLNPVEIFREEYPLLRTTVVNWKVSIDGENYVVYFEEGAEVGYIPVTSRSKAEEVCSKLRRFGIECRIIEEPYEFEYH